MEPVENHPICSRFSRDLGDLNLSLSRIGIFPNQFNYLFCAANSEWSRKNCFARRASRAHREFLLSNLIVVLKIPLIERNLINYNLYNFIKRGTHEFTTFE